MEGVLTEEPSFFFEAPRLESDGGEFELRDVADGDSCLRGPKEERVQRLVGQVR